MITAVRYRKLVGFSDLLAKAHAAGALDTALAVEDDVGAENRFLPIMHLADFEAAFLAVMLHVIILQPALSGLIADRTVDRMIDEQELQNRLAHRQDFRTLGQDAHA